MANRELILTVPFDIDEDEARFYLALKLFEEGKLTIGQAAKLSRYSKPTFMELLGRHRIPLFDYPPRELAKDIECA